MLSLVVAVVSPDPAPPVSTAAADLRLTVHEDFLNRFVQSSAVENVRVDILPGQRFNIIVDTSVSVLGTSLPVRIAGLFEVRLNGPTVEIRLLDTQVSDVTLPSAVTGYFNDSLSEINEELNIALNNVSTALDVPLILVALGSDDTTFWLEAREAR